MCKWRIEFFPRRIYMKMEFSSQRRAMLLFLTTNKAAVMSHANQQFMTFSNPLKFCKHCCTYHHSIGLFSLVTSYKQPSLVTSYKQCFAVCTSLPSCYHKNSHHECIHRHNLQYMVIKQGDVKCETDFLMENLPLIDWNYWW